MRKFVNIGTEPSFLAKVIKALSDKHGWGFEFEVHPAFDPQTTKADFVQLAIRGSWGVVGELPLHTREVKLFQACDFIYRENAKWIPRLLMHDVTKKLVVARAGHLDIRYAAYVLGRDESARVAAAFCAQAGYRHIVVVVEESGVGASSVAPLRSLFLGVEFEEMLNSQLVLRGTLGSIIMNAEELTTQPALLEDVAYFNFIIDSGFVLDSEIGKEANLLFDEALKAGLHAASGIELRFFYLQHFLQSIGIDWQVDEDEALDFLRTFI